MSVRAMNRSAVRPVCTQSIAKYNMSCCIIQNGQCITIYSYIASYTPHFIWCWITVHCLCIHVYITAGFRKEDAGCSSKLLMLYYYLILGALLLFAMSFHCSRVYSTLQNTQGLCVCSLHCAKSTIKCMNMCSCTVAVQLRFVSCMLYNYVATVAKTTLHED